MSRRLNKTLLSWVVLWNCLSVPTGWWSVTGHSRHTVQRLQTACMFIGYCSRSGINRSPCVAERRLRQLICGLSSCHLYCILAWRAVNERWLLVIYWQT